MTEPTFSDADLAYVSAEYSTLEQLCADRAETPQDVHDLIDRGQLPRPAYVLDDGTEMFPPDYFDLLDAAGGVEALPGYFDQRHRAASTALGLPGVDPREDWEGYLTGEFGVCLREVTPETMVEKSALVAQIDTLTAVPAAEDAGWREQLRAAVDELDEIERPFTDYDRQRWGSTSRDAKITAVRAQYLSGQ
ncbi:MAG TPA: DUF6058 family natural product biosynthesis protein [Nocardioidaceae bacterium]|nr:DUF6058 family natural product biosynthesis protein [Nocardioidaceae bacterium]